MVVVVVLLTRMQADIKLVFKTSNEREVNYSSNGGQMESDGGGIDRCWLLPKIWEIEMEL